MYSVKTVQLYKLTDNVGEITYVHTRWLVCYLQRYTCFL